MIDINYRILDLVERTGSLTRTAEILHLTPSAVSHSIKKMEERLGMQILIRNRDGVRLTVTGMELLPHIRFMIRAEERIQQEISRIGGLRADTLHLGVFSSVGCCWLPDLIRIMKEQCPQVEIHVHEDSYAGLENSLANGELNAAFVSLPVAGRLPSYPLLRDRLLCVAPKDFRPANGSYVTISEMLEQTFILPHKESDFDAAAFLKENHIDSLNAPHSIREDAVIIALVKSGLGMTIMPELVLNNINDDVNAYPIETAPYRTIGIALQRHEYVTPAARSFVKVVQQYIADRYPEEKPYFRADEAMK